MESMPDTALTLIAVAPLIPGGARITGLATLRIKECDRISIPARQLDKIGVKTNEGPDFSMSPSSILVGASQSSRSRHMTITEWQ